MSNSLYKFGTPQIEIVVRSVDFVGAVFDHLKAGTISEAVARKAVIETLLTGDCSQTARLWTMLIENHASNDLDNVSLIEPDDGQELAVSISPGKDKARAHRPRRKRLTKAA
jgi:hypothetical protein